MRAYDFNAVVYDGAVRCVNCLPSGVTVDDESVHPIFADSEWDYFPVCDTCGCQHDYVTLIGEGEAREPSSPTRSIGGCGTFGVRSASCDVFNRPNDPTPPQCSPPPIPEGAARPGTGKEVCRLSFAEAIRRCVSEADPVMAGQVCDQLRFRHGLNYDQIQRLVEKLTGLDAHDWEALMYEADTLEAKPTKN